MKGTELYRKCRREREEQRENAKLKKEKIRLESVVEILNRLRGSIRGSVRVQ